MIEEIFMEHYTAEDINVYCEVALKSAQDCMKHAETEDYYFFYKGKSYAYAEIIRLLEFDSR